jgi:hypothetical protein
VKIRPFSGTLCSVWNSGKSIAFLKKHWGTQSRFCYWTISIFSSSLNFKKWYNVSHAQRMAHYDKKLLFGGNCAPHCKDERKALYIDKFFCVVILSWLLLWKITVIQKRFLYVLYKNLVKRMDSVLVVYICSSLYFHFWSCWKNGGETRCSWFVLKFLSSRFYLPNISPRPQ